MQSDTPAPLHNQPEYTVSELSSALKRTVESAYDYVRVRGEISGCKPAPSGHLYFSLKDDNAVLAAICWKNTASKLSIKPEDGLEVICSGKLTTYPGQSKYQLVAESIEPYGVGALMALLDKRKKQLAAEGLFDPARKKKLPLFPSVIGIVTSPTGAVIRDILHRLGDRFPCHVLLWPVLVQGDQAAGQIAAAIHGFNSLEPGGAIPIPDVLIIARGGGSLEDLWAFNEEIVVRAAAASRIPLISAVGHETDTTLIDFASDVRAPTPTAAAEMAVPVRHELLMFLQESERRMSQNMTRFITEKIAHIQGLARGLPNPEMVLMTATQRFDDITARLALALPRLVENWAERLRYLQLNPAPLLKELQQAELRSEEVFVRLQRAYSHMLTRQEERLMNFAALLESYHYKKVLERGFALIRDDKERVVTSVANIEAGKYYKVEMKDGGAEMVAAGEKTGKVKKKVSPQQESLF